MATFDPIFAADPDNPELIAQDASITIFDPDDASMTPITITDATGSPLPNPVTVNDKGWGPAIKTPTGPGELFRIGWSGAGFEGFFTSYEGMRDATLAAKASAETAALEAAASAALVGAPADTAVETLVKAPGSATAMALSDTLVSQTDVWLNPKSYGAKGDGVADDYPGIQDAIDDANAKSAASAFGLRYGIELPPGRFKLSQGLDSRVGNRLSLRGSAKESSSIDCGDAAFTGAIINARTTFDISHLTILGNNKDGTIGILGLEDVNYSPKAQFVTFYNVDWGIKLAGGMEIGLIAHFSNIYVYNVRTCGVFIGTGGGGNVLTHNPVSGQSAWSFENIVVTNGEALARSIPAPSLVQTNDVTTTTDTLTWSGSNSTELGYVVMRRLTTATTAPDYGWEHVAYVEDGVTSYTATKTAGTTYVYDVVRKSVGLYLRHGKAINIGTVQCEYIGQGIVLRECRAVQIGTIYQEWRGNSQTAPTPRGDAIYTASCTGLNIGSIWAEGCLSAVSLSNCSAVSILTGRADKMQRSGVHYAATDASQTLTLGHFKGGSGTPVKVSTSGSANDHNLTGSNLMSLTDDTVLNQHGVNHTTQAEYAAFWRGAKRAAVGGDVTSGYLQLTSGLPVAAVAFDGQVRRQDGRLYVCSADGLGGYSWVEFVKNTRTANGAGQFLEVKRTDGSQTATFGYDGNGNLTAAPGTSLKDMVVTQGGFRLGAAGPFWRPGTGSPEGVLTAPVGSTYSRTDGGAGTTFYVKESGVGNTGWVAK